MSRRFDLLLPAALGLFLVLPGLLTLLARPESTPGPAKAAVALTALKSPRARTTASVIENRPPNRRRMFSPHAATTSPAKSAPAPPNVTAVLGDTLAESAQ